MNELFNQWYLARKHQTSRSIESSHYFKIWCLGQGFISGGYASYHFAVAVAKNKNGQFIVWLNFAGMSTQTNLMDYVSTMDRRKYSEWILRKHWTMCDVVTWFSHIFEWSISNCDWWIEVRNNNIPVTSGLPQGSILGPFLFNLFINRFADELKV